MPTAQQLQAQAEQQAQIFTNAVLNVVETREQQRRRITVRDRAEKDPARGFRSPHDFLDACMGASRASQRDDVDQRLRPLFVQKGGDLAMPALPAIMLPVAFTPASLRAAAGSDEQSGVALRWGGGVGEQWHPTALGIGTPDPTAGRTMPLAMREPIVHVSARVDKNHSTSVTGGLVVSRKAETLQLATSRMEFEQIELKVASLYGATFATNMLADEPSVFRQIIAAGFGDEFAAVMVREKIRGYAPEYMGVLNSPARITIAKESGQAAATIVPTNIVKMVSRCWGFENAIWLANENARPQLLPLALAIGTAGERMYKPSTSPGAPPMLEGAPVYYTEFCSTLGTEGDLILVNWSQYLDCLYQPLQSAESVHVRWSEDETAFKFWLRNAGAPWWRSPLTPANSTVTLSPIVTLETRS